MLAVRFEGEAEQFLGNKALRGRKKEKNRGEIEKYPKSAAAINLRSWATVSSWVLLCGCPTLRLQLAALATRKLAPTSLQDSSHMT